MQDIVNKYLEEGKTYREAINLAYNEKPKMQIGGQVDMYGSSINAPIEQKNITRSFYDSRRGVINVGTDFNGMPPEEQDELIAHENRHDWQYKNDRSNFEITHNPEYAFNERLQKKPNIVNTDEIFNKYHDRQQKETDLEIVNFKKRQPQFNFVPNQMLYDKGFVDNLYDNPNSLEGEAQYYQKTGERSFQTGGTSGSKSWDEQLERVKKEKASKPLPKLSVADLIAEKKLRDQNIGRELPQIQRDNTRVNINNRPELVSKVARNKTDKEIADERKYLREQDAKSPINIDPFNPDSYTRQNWKTATQGLESEFRVSDEPNVFDDYLNPANMIGGMGASLGSAPLRAQQEDSYMPYVTSIGAPLAVGALAGIGANSTSQFVNNLANPLAGTGDLINNLGNKYLPNLGKKIGLKQFDLNSFSPNSFLRQVDEATFKEGLESGLIKGKQNVDMTKGEEVINLNKSFGDDAYYKKGSLYSPQKADYIYEVRKGEEAFVPKVNNRTRGFTTENTPIRVSREPIPLNEATIYKKDWLQGYKELPKIPQNFESEINRGINYLEDSKTLFSKKFRDANNYELRNYERFPEITNENVDGAFNEYKKELVDYTETPIFKKRVKESFPEISFEDYKNKYLDNLNNIDIVKNTGKYNPLEQGVAAQFKLGDLNLKIKHDIQFAPGASKDALIHEVSHARVAGKDLTDTMLPKWFKKEVPLNQENSSMYGTSKSSDYYSMPEEVDARLQTMRQDLKDLKFNDYTKKNINEDSFYDFVDYSNRNKKNISDDSLELLDGYDSDFIFKALNKLPSLAPIAGASYLATQGRQEPKQFQQGGSKTLTQNEINFLNELVQLK